MADWVRAIKLPAFPRVSRNVRICLRIPTDVERLGQARPVLVRHWGETRSDYEIREIPAWGAARDLSLYR